MRSWHCRKRHKRGSSIGHTQIQTQTQTHTHTHAFVFMCMLMCANRRMLVRGYPVRRENKDKSGNENVEASFMKGCRY